MKISDWLITHNEDDFMNVIILHHFIFVLLKFEYIGFRFMRDSEPMLFRKACKDCGII